MNAVETKKVNNYLIEIFVDETPESPRTWCNLGTMICFHKRYSLGDKHSYDHDEFNSWSEMEEAIMEREGVHTILPLYLFDHGGITINTAPFSCRWDSGQVGFIFVSKDKVKEEGIDSNKVEDYLKGEVETYDQYLRGDVYGYRISKISTCDHGHEHTKEVDSCWGFYGEDECMAEAEDMVNHYSTILK